MILNLCGVRFLKFFVKFSVIILTIKMMSVVNWHQNLNANSWVYTGRSIVRLVILENMKDDDTI
jgi:hypothetical protein